MNADRESNRLPLRAGAMLLFAVAIVFVGLGWHSAATANDNPEEQLQAAQSSAPSTTASAPATTSTVNQGNTTICVINAGEVTGLAGEVDSQVKAKGYTTEGITSESNYSQGGFSENSIVYSTTAQKPLAQKLNDDLGGEFSVDSRSSLGSGFSRCAGGIAVVVVRQP
ncbi:LytR C-terminal domain-containing protein [Gordonia sp. NPDC003950]